MQPSKLQKLDLNTARDLFASGRISQFEFELYEYLNGAIAWKTYDAAAVVALRDKLKVTQEVLAAILRVSLPTVQRWESGTSSVPPLGQIVLNVLDRLGVHFFRFLKSDFFSPEHLIAIHQTQSAPSTECLDLSFAPAQAPTEFNAETVIELRRKFGLPRKALAELVGVTSDAVRKWEHGITRPNRSASKFMHILWRDGPEKLA